MNTENNGNAPNFTPPQTHSETVMLARENARLAAELSRVQIERDGYKTTAEQATTATSKATELEKELEALRVRANDLEAQSAALTAEKTTNERKNALEGKVSNADMALKLLDPAKHVDGDGKVKLESLLADYPALAPAGIAVSTAPAEPIAGGRAISLDQALSSNDNSAINAAFDAELGGNK